MEAPPQFPPAAREAPVAGGTAANGADGADGANGADGAEGYEPFDPDYLESVLDKVLAPLMQHYFRPVLLGAERIPRHGPLILAPNHSANAFPYDGMLLDALLWEREGRPYQGKIRSLQERELAVNRWMRPAGADNFWRRCGGAALTFDNFDRLLARGERLVHHPEGVAGIGKGFYRRYRLQPFSANFILLAARHRAPVLPVYVVNAEWMIPYCFTFRWLDRLVRPLFGAPSVPLPAALLCLLLPWLWYSAWPARMVFVVGEPLDMHQLATDAGITDLEAPDRGALRQLAERLRSRCQSELDQQVGFHGRRPYDARLLGRELCQGRRRLARILPTGWPVTFQRHDRDRRRQPSRNRLHAMLRDWDLAGFYLPFGWALLGLARRLRRPPCGFRGLSAEQRREAQGTFLWQLKDRPLSSQPPDA